MHFVFVDSCRTLSTHQSCMCTVNISHENNAVFSSSKLEIETFFIFIRLLILWWPTAELAIPLILVAMWQLVRVSICSEPAHIVTTMILL